MTVLSRALLTGAQGVKKKKDSSEDNKMRDAVRAQFATYQEEWLDLKQQLKIVQSADINKPGNKFLVVERIETGRIIEKIPPGESIKNLNSDILKQFTWIDSEFIRFTAYPITEKYSGYGMMVRFLIWGKTDIPGPVLVKAYTEVNDHTLFPDHPSTMFTIEPNSILVVDMFISGITKEYGQNYFLTMFSYLLNENAEVFFMKKRTKANFEIEVIEVNEYQDLKESKFLNLVEQKHVHPLTVKSIMKKQTLGSEYSKGEGRKQILKWGSAIFILVATMPVYVSLNGTDFIFWFMLVFFSGFILYFGIGVYGGLEEIRMVKKAVNLMIIDKRTRNTLYFKPVDEKWAADFCEISTYWNFNAEIEDLNLAFSVK